MSLLLTLCDRSSSREIFPKSFTVYRKDRINRVGGGVFIAVKNSIVSQAISVITQIETPMLDFQNEINSVASKYTERNLIVSGDFNVPSIDWEIYSFIPGGRDKVICEALVDTFTSNSLFPIPSAPNRGENILDLLATNIPNQVINVGTVEGISDRRVVTAKLSLNTAINLKKRA